MGRPPQPQSLRGLPLKNLISPFSKLEKGERGDKGKTTVAPQAFKVKGEKSLWGVILGDWSSFPNPHHWLVYLWC